jgi:hypothetical protein
VSRQPTGARASADAATYVYCIVARTRRPAVKPVPGVPGAGSIRLLALGRSAWAVASTVPLETYGPGRLDSRLQDLEWVSRVALGHEQAVEQFVRMRDTTVVPLKVFTLFSDDERAVLELDGRRRQWLDAVRRIRGCTEWGVRVIGMSSAPTRAPRSRPDSGVAFLTAKKRALDDARSRAAASAGAADRVYAQLSRAARASRRLEAPAQAVRPPLLDAAFLVQDTRQRRFDAAVARAAAVCAEAGAELILTGPWPAYNFVQVPGARS